MRDGRRGEGEGAQATGCSMLSGGGTKGQAGSLAHFKRSSDVIRKLFTCMSFSALAIPHCRPKS